MCFLPKMLLSTATANHLRASMLEYVVTGLQESRQMISKSSGL